MFKFNNNHIFTGYIKQLLASFNLPNCRIYTKQHLRYKEKYGEESPEIIKSIIRDDRDDNSNETITRYIPYIKDGKIEEYIQIKTDSGIMPPMFFWKELTSYPQNRKILNYTKNLKIKNNIYDSYTHEYLGEYLRFQRDYNDIDLMPLYNCFSNRLCTNILFSCDHEDNTQRKVAHFTFNSSDTHYKIFMLPVKLFKEYTIAIDCASPVEICCGIYGKYKDESDLFDLVAHNTCAKYGQMNFNTPILFSKLKELTTFIENQTSDGWETVTRLAQRENDLKLFIKLPANNDSTITVLEGNYCSWNDKYIDINSTLSTTTFIQYKNHYITNYLDEQTKKIISDEKYAKTRDFKPISQLQLLMLNTKESYPFSDYLVEYLLDNVITNIDKISDNIKRVQTAIYEETNGNISHLNEIGEQDGIWDSRTRAIIYDALQYNYQYSLTEDNKIFMATDASRAKQDRSIDTLGYINHVAEYEYKYHTIDKNNNRKTESLANIDIYPDIYIEQKEK